MWQGAQRRSGRALPPSVGGVPSIERARADAVAARAEALQQQLVPGRFPNGAVLFCSPSVAEVLHPLAAVPAWTCTCGTHFETSAVTEALRIRRELTYGFIVVDGGEATIGLAQVGRGAPLSKLVHFTANIASRTRRGGQSAARYARNRDGEELAFLRKIAACAGEELSDLRGVLVGGRAELKNKLLPELPPSVRSRIAGVLTLSCEANDEGLKTLAGRLPDFAEKDRQERSQGLVQRFLDLASACDANGSVSACYGEAHTLAAMKLGAVEQVLLAEAFIGRGGRSWKAWCALAADNGATAVRVTPVGSVESSFCSGFVVGACLRYALDVELLEDMVEEGAEMLEELVAAPNAIGCDRTVTVCTEESPSECGSASTAASRSGSLLVQWLSSALKTALQDEAAAESLTMCAEVVLLEESTELEERLESCVEMLRDQGVPEELLMELQYHTYDLLAEVTPQ